LRFIFLIKQLSKINLDIKAENKKGMKMAEQNVAKIFCKASKAHRQKGSAIEANMAESEQNSFAYENS